MQRVVMLVAIALALCACTTSAPSSLIDVALVGGIVVDGTGKEPVKADVLLRGDTIVFVGNAEPSQYQGARVIDVGGQTIAPGFIDLHAHGNPLVDESFDNFLLQGVTTVVLGQDGVSPPDERVDNYIRPNILELWRSAVANTEGADAQGRPITIAQWMHAVDKKGVAVNVAPLSGFGTIRSIAGVGDAPAPTEAQLAVMTEVLRRDLEDGAFGMSSGLEYSPDRYATTDELLTMARVVGEAGGVVMSHMRSEDDDKIAGAIDELIAQGRCAPVHISHLKVVFGRVAEDAERVLAQIRAARAAGTRISADVYPYLAGYANMVLLYPPWAVSEENWREALRTRRKELEDYLEARVKRRNGPEAILITTGPYAGKTLADVMRIEKKSAAKVIIDVFGYGGPMAAHRITAEPVNRAFVAAPDLAIGTDGGPWINHPRSWGAFPKVLRERVRETRDLSLSTAIHKMSGIPGAVLDLHDRGNIAPGAKADLVVFDPGTVADRSTFENAKVPPVGISWVIVNGRIAAENGVRAEGSSGRVLRRTKRAQP
jgi:N-acyl-D-amino-acid deacylase